eukprot:363518-Chlamydomonas_euryale.AAC.9
MGRLKVSRSTCLRRIVGMKLTDHHRLETTREQRGTCSLERKICKQILQWMGHVLRMNADRLPRQAFGCPLATNQFGRVGKRKTGSYEHCRVFGEDPLLVGGAPWGGFWVCHENV